MFELSTNEDSPPISATTTVDTTTTPAVSVAIPTATPEYWANNQAASSYWAMEDDCFNYLCEWYMWKNPYNS